MFVDPKDGDFFFFDKGTVSWRLVAALTCNLFVILWYRAIAFFPSGQLRIEQLYHRGILKPL